MLILSKLCNSRIKDDSPRFIHNHIVTGSLLVTFKVSKFITNSRMDLQVELVYKHTIRVCNVLFDGKPRFPSCA